MRRIYLDHNASTPVHPEVVAAMLPYFSERYGNPSSIHSFGREARDAVEAARGEIARFLEVSPEEIVFTSGGTESDNLAIKGVAYARGGGHLITSQVEHHAVLRTCQALERAGYAVTYLPVDGYGRVDPDDVRRAVRPDTILITVMFANSEVGTIMPVAEIGRIAAERGIPFHVDAVQAFGKIPFWVRELGISLLSFSGHKIYGPKGVGALYVRRGLRLEPLLHGGGQERRLRPGTENVPGIVGLGAAARLARAELPRLGERVAALRERLIAGVLDRIPDARLNGHPERRLPGNANVSVRYVEGEAILLNLDLKGVAASSGSACAAGSTEPSHVLVAMGLPEHEARGALRFSLGRENTEADVDYVLEVLPPIVERLRRMAARPAAFPGAGLGHGQG